MLPLLANHGARSIAAVRRSENGDTATTAATRRSTAAACKAIAAPIDVPIRTIGRVATRSSTRARSCFS